MILEGPKVCNLKYARGDCYCLVSQSCTLVLMLPNNQVDIDQYIYRCSELGFESSAGTKSSIMKMIDMVGISRAA